MERNKEKINNEDYIRLSEHHFVKKDTFDYYTEKDLIARMAEKYNSSYEEAEELYEITMRYIKSRIEAPDNNYEIGYKIPYFGYFIKSIIKVRDLLSGRDSFHFRRAKLLLDRFTETKKTRLDIRK